MKNSIIKAIKELERCYQIFNRELFDNKLDKNIRITIQTKGRKKKVIGYHAPKRWQDTVSGNMITEITLCAEDLMDYDPMEVLIHESCHNYNYQRGINDCCTNQYHNKKFKQVAEEAGLIVKRDERYGWCWTSLGEKAIQVIDSISVKSELFKCFMLTTPSQTTYLKKFICDCGMIIRVARVDEFSATCNNCKSPFKLDDFHFGKRQINT